MNILINGTFDILHRGHLELINFARMISRGSGSIVIAIDSDRRVKELKGDLRPINNQDDRKFFLDNLSGVSKVKIFDSDQELENIIKDEKITLMVKGDDYVGKPIVGEHLVPYIAFIKKIDGYSTTNKIQDIISRG